MPRSLTAAVVAVAVLMGSGGCGSDDEEDTAGPAAAASPSAPAADPKREWTSALAALCTDLAGAVSGRQIADFSDDNKYSPDEIVAAQRAAQAALDAFDKGYAALVAPPEAADAKAALEAFLTASRAPAAALLKATQAGDEAALTKAFAALEGVRNGASGVASFTAKGVPEKCRDRGAYV